jgi:MFS family permease
MKKLNDQDTSKSFQRKTVSVWASMKFVVGIRRVLIMSMALIYFVSIGIPVIQITTLFAVASLIAVFMEFPTGAIADYDSRKKSLMISFFLLAFAYLGIFLVSNFWLISFFWIMGEIAWTFNTGAGGAWVVDNLKVGKEKKGIVRLISKGFLFQKGGFLVGGLVGLFVIAINFRLIWLVGAVLYLVLLFLMWKFGEERNFKPEKIPAGYLKKSFLKAGESYKFLFSKTGRNKKIMMLGNFVGAIAGGIFWIGMPLMIVESLRLLPEHLSGFQSVFALITLSIPFMAKKMKLSKGFGSYLFLTYAITAVFIILFGLSSNLTYAIILLGAVIFVLGIAEVIGDSASHYVSDSKIRASLGSIGSINGYIANAIGIFVAGVLFTQYGIPTGIVVSGVLVFVQGAVYLWMRGD